MNSPSTHRRRKQASRAVIICALLILFTPMIVSSFYGCAHTVEEVTVHDSDTVIRKDTVTDTLGGARWLRFVSMLVSGNTSIITTASGNFFSEASYFMLPYYVPTYNKQPFKLYATYFVGTTSTLDSITVPADSLLPNSLVTIALFEVVEGGSSGLYKFFAIDSAKNTPPPADSCYFRFINALPDYPQPSPSVNIYIDDPNGTPIFPSSVTFTELRNYVLVKAGSHMIYVRSETNPTVLYSTQQQLKAGRYYTSRLTGSKVGATDKFSVDGE